MLKKLLILFNLIVAHFIIAQDVGDECIPNDQIADGVCTLVTDCEAAIRKIIKRKPHQFYRCGFDGMAEIVCCPRITDKSGTTVRVAVSECERILANNITPLDLHILGGESVSPGEFPHMVALGFDRGNGYVFDCGGSLLSKTYVLTAAHCVDTMDGIAPSIVRAGVVEIGGSAWSADTDYRIAQIIKHPEYTRREKYHDLALLRLDRAVQYSSNLNAVCLETSNEDPKIPLTVTGWGKTSNTRDIKSTILLKANVTAVAREECAESYTNWRKLPQGISTDQLCAGDPAGLRDTCQGDSGGPLQGSSLDGQYRLIGVTSFGRGCGSPVPGVYTRVSHYLDWIESVVWPN